MSGKVVEEGALLGEYQAIVSERQQMTAVAVEQSVASVKPERDGQAVSGLASLVQDTVGAACLPHCDLHVLLSQTPQEQEAVYQVGLPRADEHVGPFQRQVCLPNRLVSREPAASPILASS